MCGIIGFTGDTQALPILIDGLYRLEYRGYDSAGVAIVSDDNQIKVLKKKGRVECLDQALACYPLPGVCGIGHTRWATHGQPSDENSHPHTNPSGTIALVHNGIIENYEGLKQYLMEQGYQFTSETDTEVLVNMIDYGYQGDLLAAVRNALLQVEGSYAISVLDLRAPGTIVCARKDSPLVLGRAEKGSVVASDIPAILAHTRNVYFLKDYETALLTPHSLQIYDRYGQPLQEPPTCIDWDIASAEKGGYAHFMLKEIHEESKSLRDTLRPRLKNGEIVFQEIDIESLARDTKRIFLVACGTAYHACLVGKYSWEQLLRLPVEVDYASEFRYRDPVIGPEDLMIVISQSGETADSLAALRLAKACGAKTLAITNVVGSTLSREVEACLYTWAGPEIAVASTKAYSTQLLCLYLLALAFGRAKGSLSHAAYQSILEEIRMLPELVEQVFACEEDMMRLAHLYHGLTDAYFIGRGVDYAVALEGSLKLKEISYIHSEAFAAGELKHGPIALLEKGSLLIVLATQPTLYDKVISNIKETAARGAHVVVIAPKDAQSLAHAADNFIAIPLVSALLAPILSVIPTQLFAYYCALERGYDVDKPRNLAKSVTVE